MFTGSLRAASSTWSKNKTFLPSLYFLPCLPIPRASHKAAIVEHKGILF